MVVLGQEFQAFCCLPLIKDEGRPQQHPNEAQERENLNGHVSQGCKHILQDDASGERERLLTAFEFLLKQVSEEAKTYSTSNGPAEDENSIRARLVLRGRLRSRILNQPPVGGNRVHHEAFLARTCSVLGVSVATIVHDENVGLEALVHISDVLQAVAYVASVSVEVDESVRRLVAGHDHRVEDEPSMNHGPILRPDPHILIG
mmetsp:Transcript_63137/g.137247  ORF Transcript_63137/g.137247 Transcript_63137/m.137247 type:complete len:203 (+) Transcript_63137:319-927(+)